MALTVIDCPSSSPVEGSADTVGRMMATSAKEIGVSAAILPLAGATARTQAPAVAQSTDVPVSAVVIVRMTLSDDENDPVGSVTTKVRLATSMSQPLMVVAPVVHSMIP